MRRGDICGVVDTAAGAVDGQASCLVISYSCGVSFLRAAEVPCIDIASMLTCDVLV